MTISVHRGDCRDVLATLPEASIDACVTDPPYGLEFMGKGWDSGVPGVEFWAEVFRDPFAGSGTTGLAAMAEGFAATLIEADAGYADIIASRITRAKATPVQETMDL
jgi:DNA modification methylase